MPRRLGPDDYVYRVIDPDHRDEHGPQPIAFEDPGKGYPSVSFFVSAVASPRDALAAIARYSRAKAVCKTKKTPLAAEMYDCGFRVARIPAKFLLDAISATKAKPNPLGIDRTDANDYAENGHLDLRNGQKYSQILASEQSGIIELSREATLTITSMRADSL